MQQSNKVAPTTYLGTMYIKEATLTHAKNHFEAYSNF